MVNGAKQLPDGWEWKTLAGAAANEKNAIVDGPFGSNLKVSDYVDDTNAVPVLTTKNFERGYGVENLRFISHQKYEQLKRSEVHSGDILVAKIGSCGKTGIYPQNMRSAIIPANLLKFTVHPDVNRMFVYYYLNSPYFQNELGEIITATAQPAFSVTKFRTLPIPLPPLSEQERIVAKIEELFTQLDAGTSALERVQAGLRRYKASVLKAACEGKLVENGKVESGELPKDWRFVKLGSVFQVKIGKTPSRSKPEYWNGDIHWVSSGEVRNFRIKETRENITEKGLGNTKLYPIGTVLLAMIGEGKTRGQAAILDIEATTNQNIAAILSNPAEAIPEWIFYWLLSRYEETRKSGVGGMQYALNSERIRNFDVPLPPLEEQREIVAEVERRLSVARQVENSVEVALVRASRLRQAVLKSAFEGRLT